MISNIDAIDYLTKNWDIIENSEYKGIIFLFDEFHLVQDLKNKRWFTLSDFLAVLNEVQKQGCKYNAVLCGLPILQINVKMSRSYTERMFKSLEITHLKKNESLKAVTGALKNSQFRFSTKLINALIKDTGGYPYFIQFFGKEIINNLNKKSIDEKDYQQIKHKIIQQLEYDFFDPRLEILSEDEKSVLFAMRKVKESDISFKIISKTLKVDKRKISKYLERLEAKGLIYKYKHGIYRFSIPMLKEYLIRKSQK